MPITTWIKPLTLSLLAIGTPAAFAHQGPLPFSILPNTHHQYLMATNATLATGDNAQAIAIVKETLHLTDASPYAGVRIRTLYDGNSLSALIVYLLSDRTKDYQLVRLNLQSNEQGLYVSQIIRPYTLQTADFAQSPHYAYQHTPECPDPKVQFVIGNNFTGDQSVEAAVHRVYEAAEAAGYHPFLMTTNNPNAPQPTVSAYENWMSCKNVKAFYNESHGSPSGILLTDGDFRYTLVDQDLKDKLNHKIVLFDSCSTFNDPLLSAMTQTTEGDAQQYMAGIVPLPFGASEQTAACVLTQAVAQHAEMTQNLIETCAKQSGLDPMAFRIKGNGADVLDPAQSPEPA